PPCKLIPILKHDIVNSETPACRNAPEKSPCENAFVSFKNPSVLSELDRSAEATIIFSTVFANSLSTVAEPALVAEFGFCCIVDQSIFGSSLENHFFFLSTKVGFSFSHALSLSILAATIAFNSSLLFE